MVVVYLTSLISVFDTKSVEEAVEEIEADGSDMDLADRRVDTIDAEATEEVVAAAGEDRAKSKVLYSVYIDWLLQYGNLLDVGETRKQHDAVLNLVKDYRNVTRIECYVS